MSRYFFAISYFSQQRGILSSKQFGLFAKGRYVMNEASRWRFALAQQIGNAYAANPKTQVVMVAGSTGRGTADRYSDLEIDVYYSAPPTEEERRATAERCNGLLLDLDEGDDEWAEEISIAGFHIGTSTFLVETMERYLKEILEDYSAGSLAQIRLYSLLHAKTLLGEQLVSQWVTRAQAYPTPLVHAMLRENLNFEGFGYAEDMLAARDDLLILYDIFCRVERQILGALLGLNRIYLPNPGFKNMDELIAEMSITPPNLSQRLKQAFQLPPTEGVNALHLLIEDIFQLVEIHVLGFDVISYRENMRQRRGVWDQAPDER
jgi:hypothetical protein